MIHASLALCTDQRRQLLQTWLQHVLANQSFELEALANDASFRRYFRVYGDNWRYIVMDALPGKEDCRSFIAIAQAFYQLGLCTPSVYAVDEQQGFMLLSDLGDRLLLNELTVDRADHFYRLAIDDLLLIQSCQANTIVGYDLPYYDTALYRYEINLFTEWFLAKQLQWSMSHRDQQQIEQLFERFVAIAKSQPQVCVHRDYHSRNILVQGDQTLGIIDFQDAVWGPVTYDLVSLLRDCYVDWPVDQVISWISYFQQRALSMGYSMSEDIEQLFVWVDWMGLQRNLKCLGIFSRLHLRDNKPQYLQYCSRIFNYALTVCHRYAELRSFGDWLACCREAWYAQTEAHELARTLTDPASDWMIRRRTTPGEDNTTAASS